jgi:eukaryotic-like serine/threonine-protein kinase
MSTVSSDQWPVLSAYLEEALSLTDEARSAWLSATRTRNPLLADQLEKLLEEHRIVESAKFLHSAPVGTIMDRLTVAGQTLGVYTLLSQTGEGGMSTVWLAERNDGRFERRVAVKFLNIALIGREGEDRFRREGKILGLLVHPHIAELVDAGVSEAGQPYLVLEHVEGDHIDSYCDDRKLDIHARLRLFLDVLEAVAKAHSNLIVHRDLKPSNILVRIDGEVKLLDFGIAKLLEDEGGDLTQITVAGVGLMTPKYAAPEQMKGETVTTATDIFALGTLLYVLLTGCHPCSQDARTPAELITTIIDTEPPRASDVASATWAKTEPAEARAAHRSATPEKLRRQLRGDLDTILAKALKKSPAERYASVTAFADDIRRHLRNEPISARPETLSYRAIKFVRRNLTVVALVTLALFATVAGLIGTLMQARTARLERDFALRQLKRSAALNDFHNFLLSDAAPSGKPFTVHALLDRAEQIVARQHATDDPNRVELMVNIGEQDYIQDEAESSRRILEEAYKLSQGLSDVSVRARAACALASSVARDADITRAENLLQEGLRELPKSPQFALERIDCLQNGAQIALVSNDVQKYLDRTLEAQRVLRESPFDSDSLEMDRWVDLAGAYSRAGQGNEALSAYEHADVLLSWLGRDNTTTAAVLFQNWALGLDQMGRPLEAEAKFRRAIAIERAGETEDAVSPITLINYAKTLRELGRLTEAKDYAERASSKAQRVNHQIAVNISLMERARIYTALHDHPRASAALAEAESRLKQALPPGHYAFAILASEQALNALDEGDLSSALKFANQAVSIDEAAIKAGGDSLSNMPSLLLRRSTIELAAGRLEESLADANRARTQLQKGAQPETYSSYIGHAYLSIGRALKAQGKLDEAHSAFAAAKANLQKTVGPNHPDTQAASHLAS